jgi:hypothetical protein
MVSLMRATSRLLGDLVVSFPWVSPSSTWIQRAPNAILYLLNRNLSDEVYRMGIIQKKCSICGKVFTTLDKKSKYCSAQCAGKANKKK